MKCDPQCVGGSHLGRLGWLRLASQGLESSGSLFILMSGAWCLVPGRTLRWTGLGLRLEPPHGTPWGCGFPRGTAVSEYLCHGLCEDSGLRSKRATNQGGGRGTSYNLASQVK